MKNEMSYNPLEVMLIDWMGVSLNEDPMIPMMIGLSSQGPMFLVAAREINVDLTTTIKVMAVPMEVLAELYAQISHFKLSLNEDEQSLFRCHVETTERTIREMLAAEKENAPGSGIDTGSSGA